MDVSKLSGSDLLRLVVQNMDRCGTDFNQRFTAEQLIQLHKMFLESEWEIYPDQWTERQLREALAGKVPRWNETGTRARYK